MYLSIPGSSRSPSMAVSLLTAGDMREDANKEAFFDTLNIDKKKVVYLKQIHSRQVYIAEQIKTAGLLEGDGLVAGGKENILGVFMADCLPVFLYHSTASVFGVVHSGWKGTGIAGKAVNKMCRKWGLSPRDIIAVLGPCIGVCCYLVDEKRAHDYQKKWGADVMVQGPRGHMLDMKQANRVILQEAGLKDIQEMNYCTGCDERFGSFRRQGPDSYTLMLALIGYFH